MLPQYGLSSSRFVGRPFVHRQWSYLLYLTYNGRRGSLSAADMQETSSTAERALTLCVQRSFLRGLLPCCCRCEQHCLELARVPARTPRASVCPSPVVLSVIHVIYLPRSKG